MYDERFALKDICHSYLIRLRYMAKKHGLDGWLEATIRANAHDECEPTKKEVEILSRIVDDERVNHKDIPAILGKSYGSCYGNGHFDKVKKLKRVGIYSKVSAMLLANKLNSKKDGGDKQST